MTWGNPPKLEPTKAKRSKRLTAEMIAKDSEHSHQAALFAWAALSVGKYPKLKYMFAVPNGGYRDMGTAITLKAEGVRAGVPDIFLPVFQWSVGEPGGLAGCFIEMKVGKNKTTKEQNEYIEYLQSEGYYCKVCYSWTEARDTLIAYLEGKL